MGVVEHHAFRVGGGSGGVLQQAGGVAFRGGSLVRLAEAGEMGCGVPRGAAGGADPEDGAGIVEDGFQAAAVAAAARRVGRDGDRAGIPAGEEAGDEIRARWLREQHRLAGDSQLGQAAGQGAGLLVELAVAELMRDLPGIVQKAVGGVIRSRGGPSCQHGGQWLRGEVHGGIRGRQGGDHGGIGIARESGGRKSSGMPTARQSCATYAIRRGSSFGLPHAG